MKLRPSFAERVAAHIDDMHIHAARDLIAGKATEHQQKLLTAWLLNSVCRVKETTFWPGDPGASAYLEGRRSVAADLVALAETKTEHERNQKRDD